MGKMNSQERQRLRQEKLKPAMEEFFAWCAKEKQNTCPERF